HRQRGGAHNFPAVIQHRVTRHGNYRVWQSPRKSEPCRGSSERIEAEVFEVDGTAYVPGIRQDETSLGVQFMESGYNRCLITHAAIVLGKSSKFQVPSLKFEI